MHDYDPLGAVVIHAAHLEAWKIANASAKGNSKHAPVRTPSVDPVIMFSGQESPRKPHVGLFGNGPALPCHLSATESDTVSIVPAAALYIQPVSNALVMGLNLL